MRRTGSLIPCPALGPLLPQAEHGFITKEDATMSDTLFYFLMGLVIFVIGPLLVRLRNQGYSNTEEGQEALNELDRYAEEVVSAEEQVLLKDYSHITKTMVVLTDKGLHSRKGGFGGTENINVTYGQISTAEYTDYGGYKTSSARRVHRVQMNTRDGSCVLTCFPQQEQIAEILMERVS